MNENLEALNKARENGGTVTYHFENGSKVVSNINKEVFVNERGRERSSESILSIFQDTCHDLGAVSFNL